MSFQNFSEKKSFYNYYTSILCLYILANLQKELSFFLKKKKERILK